MVVGKNVGEAAIFVVASGSDDGTPGAVQRGKISVV